MNLKLKLTNGLFVSEITKKEVNVITVPNKENVIVQEPKTKVNLCSFYFRNYQERSQCDYRSK